jgi:hypothetical protein
MGQRSSRWFGEPASSRRAGWRLGLLALFGVALLGSGWEDVRAGHPWRGVLRAGLWLLMCGFLAFAVLRQRGAARSRECAESGCCGGCGYDLTGNTSGVCPECGAPAAEAKL